MKSDAKSTIEAGKAILGIEFGSTRIKAVLIDQENKTDCGLTVWKLSGMACKTAMQISVPT